MLAIANGGSMKKTGTHLRLLSLFEDSFKGPESRLWTCEAPDVASIAEGGIYRMVLAETILAAEAPVRYGMGSRTTTIAFVVTR